MAETSRSRHPQASAWADAPAHEATFDELGRNPYPAKCRDLRLPDNVPNSIRADWKVRRVQLDDWRVVYAASETWHEIAVLTVEKRPPYDYEDLEALLSDLA